MAEIIYDIFGVCVAEIFKNELPYQIKNKTEKKNTNKLQLYHIYYVSTK